MVKLDMVQCILFIEYHNTRRRQEPGPEEEVPRVSAEPYPAVTW
jgi:hypothetical protein